MRLWTRLGDILTRSLGAPKATSFILVYNLRTFIDRWLSGTAAVLARFDCKLGHS